MIHIKNWREVWNDRDHRIGGQNFLWAIVPEYKGKTFTAHYTENIFKLILIDTILMECLGIETYVFFMHPLQNKIKKKNISTF